MSSSSKCSEMSQDWKFQQRWEFRRRDDNFDSSSDDSKSSSGGEPVLKKHKLVSNLILPKIDETSERPESQQEDQFESNTGGHFEFGKANKMHIGLSKKNNTVKRKRGSFKDTNKKKKKCITHEPVSLDKFKIFVASILEELKVAREKMFTTMREEMKKLVAVETGSRPTRKEGSCAQNVVLLQHQISIEPCKKTNSNSSSFEKSVKSNRKADSNKCCEVLEERDTHEQAVGAITLNEKVEGERLRFSVRKPNCSSNTPDQVVSSAYLTLPTVQSKQNHYPDSSLCNYIQPGPAGNTTDVSSERANLMIDVSAQRGYLSCIQQEDQFESFAQMGSKNMGCFDQHITQASSMGTGFPIPLHRGLDNGFNIPRQILQENSSEDNNVLGLRLNGGAMRFSGGSYALSEHSAANNFRSRTNYKTDFGLMAFGTQDLKGGHLYPN
ncbi:hypothetical protein F0562_013222 [Nyssa sinensis]|uniref:Uncharacterized protein n=1 Tax=Nyssa sinensis TaxID=561372 RepID=A0A5J4ZZ95_9ASTE|nr:hypothetical protein F0562_013222 [Nyssa sinensis]